MRQADKNPRDFHSARDMIGRQVQHMVRLVDDLLDVSRISRGKINIRKEPTELGMVLQSAIETSRPLIQKAGHELTVQVPPGSST
jgi:signal transduction histidine kinase